MPESPSGFDVTWAPPSGRVDSRQPVAPDLEGERVYLRPVDPADYPMLRAAETEGEAAVRWRYRGRTPSPDEWLQTLWSGVLAQFIVVERQSDTPIGFVYAYRPSIEDGHCHFAVMRFGHVPPTPLMTFGLALFVDYLFHLWPMRVLYAEVAEFNYPQFRSGHGRFFEIEGCLKQHYCAAGEVWDLYLLAVHRDRWLEQSAGALRLARGQHRTQVRLSMPTGRAPI